MSQQKGKVARSFEDCLERSKPALKDELISELRQEIIHSELSPDKIWREAKRRLQKLRVTANLGEEDEALTRSYWWLAKTKRDHREGLEKWIEQEEKGMKKEKIKVRLGGMLDEVDIDKWSAVKLCNELLSAMAESDSIDELMHFPPHTCAGATERDLMRDKMIQILEEKFGLKVKVCGNCKCFKKCLDGYVDVRGDRTSTFQGFCELLPTHERGSGRNADERRENCWVPKEKEVEEDPIEKAKRLGRKHFAT